MRCLVIPFLAVQHPRHLVQFSLHRRNDINGVTGRTGSGQGGLGLGQIAEGVVDSCLDEVRLDEQLLVIKFLEFTQELIDQGEGVRVLSAVEEERGEAGLDALTQEGTFLGDAPGDDLGREGGEGGREGGDECVL